MSPAELSALSAYHTHDQAHPGAVAWLEGGDHPATRATLDQLTASGHLERGLFGLRRITSKGRGALIQIDGARRI